MLVYQRVHYIINCLLHLQIQMRLFPPIPASNPRNCAARHKQLQPDVRRLRVSFEGYKRVQTTNHCGILRIIKIWIIIMIIMHTTGPMQCGHKTY